MSPVEAPDIEENRTFNLLTSIWVVPLIALIITGWLVYQHFNNLGSEIRIDFASSDGLIAGESVIKFRDVAVGKIVRIQLQEGGDGVSVFARMNKEAEPYLNPSSHFWIVSPQVDYSGVRGLDTLIHGAYITMSSVRHGDLVTEFVGSDKPYRGEEEGMYFHLETNKIGNVHIGAPVYYRNLRAGVVEKIALSDDKQMTNVTVFVQRDFANLVNVTTKFWHQDLVAVSMEGGEIALDLAPITSVLLGSVSFESKLDQTYSAPPKQHLFHLFNKHSDATREKIGAAMEDYRPFQFAFVGEVSGLHTGAPIRYQGFKIGWVDQSKVHYDCASRSMQAEVLGRIDASIFKDHEHNGTANLAQAVRQGLRAELRSNNPLIDSLYIHLAYPSDANATPGKWVTQDGVTRFPTQKVVKGEPLSRLNKMLASWTALADENRQPLRQALETLKQSLENINHLTAKPSFQSLSDDLNGTLGTLGGLMGKNGGLDAALKELQQTLKTTKRVMRGYGSGSLFGKKLDAMLKEVGQTSEETKRLIEKLNKKPNALIFGE